METYTLEQITDEFIGKKGTPEREQFEFELKLDLLGDAVKRTRKERKLTQQQLGEIVGVKKAQISKIENGLNNVTINTIMKVFKALQVKINFNIEFADNKFVIA